MSSCNSVCHHNLSGNSMDAYSASYNGFCVLTVTHTCVRACVYNFTNENRSPDSSGIIDTSGQVAKYQQRSIQETFVVAEEDDDWDDDEDW